MENKPDNLLRVLLFILLALVVALIVTVGSNKVQTVEVEYNGPSANDMRLIFSEEISKIEFPEIDPRVSGDYVLNQEEYEEEQSELEAERLALLELQNDDLRDAIFDALVLYGEDIEDENHITEIRLRDLDVDFNEVEMDLKVFYYIDGDEDEAYRARLNEFVISISDLEFDDEFEDAEVNESYLSSISVYKVYD